MARVKPSATGAALALAAELRAAGRDIISLGTGEPDFDTPQAIKDAAIRAIESGVTKYTPIAGTVELKQAIQRKFLRDNGLSFDLSQIVVSSGAKQSLYNLCLALLDAGDEAIIPAPYWVSYPDMVRLSDATPVFIESGIEQGFRITPEQLSASITDKSKLLFINSPSNPTGASYSAAEFRALGSILEEHPDIVVVSDEIYEPIHWSAEPFVSFASACPALQDRTVTVNGVSKAYAMTGWRIGYAAGPEELITAMTTIQSQSTSNPCSVSQKAAEAALDGDQTLVSDMTAAYQRRHDFVVPALNEIDGFECRPGEGTFYAFPKVTAAMERLGLESDIEFATFLVNKADVAVVPGSAFGAPGYLRLSFACSMQSLQEAVQRINRAVSA
jgi:aspartate aminotransferase